MSSKRAVLYARMSDTNNRDVRLDDQIAFCHDYAEEHGYAVVYELQEEPGVSGADTDRPQLERARQLAREGAFDVLIALEPARIWRESYEYGDERRRFKIHGVTFEYTDKQYADGWQGDIQEKEDAIKAEAYRLEVREKTIRGRRTAAKRGNVHCAGHPPYGYREATVDDKRTLAVDEEEAEVVRTIFRLYLDGNSNGKTLGAAGIAEYLTENKIPSHSDKGNTINTKVVGEYGAWTHVDALRMLKAPVYKGEWQYGKHTDNPITIAVPRIISDEDWEAAQVIRKKNRLVRKHPGDYEYLLQHFSYCSVCGKDMSVRNQRSEKGQLSYYTHPWLPKRYDNGDRCAGHGYYRAEDVDDTLWRYAKEVLSNPDELVSAFSMYAQRLQSRDNPTRDKLEVAQKKVAKTERKLSNLIDLYQDDLCTKQQYIERKKRLDIHLEKDSEKISMLTRELNQARKMEDHMQSITKFVEKFSIGLSTRTAAKVDARREIIRRLGLRVELGRHTHGKYADAVFYCANNNTRDVHATYSALFIPQN